MVYDVNKAGSPTDALHLKIHQTKQHDGRINQKQPSSAAVRDHFSRNSATSHHLDFTHLLEDEPTIKEAAPTFKGHQLLFGENAPTIENKTKVINELVQSVTTHLKTFPSNYRLLSDLKKLQNQLKKSIGLSEKLDAVVENKASAVELKNLEDNCPFYLNSLIDQAMAHYIEKQKLPEKQKQKVIEASSLYKEVILSQLLNNFDTQELVQFTVALYQADSWGCDQAYHLYKAAAKKTGQTPVTYEAFEEQTKTLQRALHFEKDYIQKINKEIKTSFCIINIRKLCTQVTQANQLGDYPTFVKPINLPEQLKVVEDDILHLIDLLN